MRAGVRAVLGLGGGASSLRAAARRSTPLAAAGSLVAALTSACGAPGGEPPSLTRLAGQLGPVEILEIRNESRPTVGLTPGEPRGVPVLLAEGSRLRFSFMLWRSPDRGFVRVEVRAGDVVVYSRQLHAGRQGHWWDVSVPLPEAGETVLEFRADHVYQSGAPYPTAAQDRRGWVRLASPRVYTPSVAARRVFVWISQDTVRADYLTTYGYDRPTTPGFERLSKDWIVFERAIAPASWTLPSMASQFTSRYPSFHGVGLQERPAQRFPSLFESLAEAGFTVLGASGNPLVSREFGFADGFDAYWFVAARADALNGALLEALDEAEQGDVAIFAHYMDPHAPYMAPASFAAPFATAYDGPVNGYNFKSVGRTDEADVAHVRSLYEGELAWTDSQIVFLLDALEERGLLEDAVIVYAADHGEEFLDHGGWGHSRTVYSEMVHVPFALRLPGVGPRRVSELVSLTSLAPTVLDFLGLDQPASFRGRSLLPLIRGEPWAERPVFSETQRTLDDTHRVAVRNGSRTYVLVAPSGFAGASTIIAEEFYDLGADPGEKSPLDPGGAERLRGVVLRFLEGARAEAPAAAGARKIDPEIEERLRALGYIAGDE